MARRLNYTVDQEPISLEIGGEEFIAPPVLAPTVLAGLLAKKASMEQTLAVLANNPDEGEGKAMATILGIISRPPTCPHCDQPLSPHGAQHQAPGLTLGDPQVLTSLCPATGAAYIPETGIFDVIFVDEKTAQRLRERLYSQDRPFDLVREILPAVGGLIEEYTGRPTPPSSPSSTPSPGDGTSSTDGAPAGALTPLQISAAAAGS